MVKKWIGLYKQNPSVHGVTDDHPELKKLLDSMQHTSKNLGAICNIYEKEMELEAQIVLKISGGIYTGAITDILESPDGKKLVFYIDLTI